MGLFALRAHEKGLELACRIKADVPDSLIGDPGRLRQVLIDLVGNAVKFTEAGDVVVEVSADRVTTEEAALQLTISDTGIGIPLEKQWQIRRVRAGRHVDDAPVRGHRTGPDHLCAPGRDDGRPDLADQQAGPRQPVSIRRAVRRPAAAGCRASARRIVDGLQVLVVDENATNRTVLQELLASWRMHAEVADGAAAALTKMRDRAARQRPRSISFWPTRRCRKPTALPWRSRSQTTARCRPPGHRAHAAGCAVEEPTWPPEDDCVAADQAGEAVRPDGCDPERPRGKLEPGRRPGAIESAARRCPAAARVAADDNRTNQRLVESFSEPSATRSRR